MISVLVVVSRDFELGRVSVQFMLLQLQLYSLGGGGVQRRPSVPYGANFLINEYVCVTPGNALHVVSVYSPSFSVTHCSCQGGVARLS